jgi:Zn-dependent protease
MLLLVSLALFAIATWSQGDSLAKLAMLVAVLFFHELGHYVGMLAFGYRDVRMFFVPFFGAAVAGKRGTVSRTREAFVLLLGPAPGIILGFVLAVASVPSGSALVHQVAMYLLVVNGLNLLPMAPLDGGQLFVVLLFSRWVWTEQLFSTAATLGLIAYGVFGGAPSLVVVGLFVALTLPIRGRMMRVASSVRAQFPSLENEPAQLGEGTTRALFVAVREALPTNARQNAKAVASWMADVLDRASQRPPSVAAATGIFAIWVATLTIALAGVAIGRWPGSH